MAFEYNPLGEDFTKASTITGGGGSNTDLSTIRTIDTVTVVSSTGNNVDITGATQGTAGILTGQDKTILLDFTTVGSGLNFTGGNFGINEATPTVSLDINGTDGLRIPSGTTAQRPGTNDDDHVLRRNTTRNMLEYHDGTDWRMVDIDEVITDNDANTLPIIFTGTFTTGSTTQSSTQRMKNYVKINITAGTGSSTVQAFSGLYTDAHLADDEVPALAVAQLCGYTFGATGTDRKIYFGGQPNFYVEWLRFDGTGHEISIYNNTGETLNCSVWFTYLAM